MKLMKTIDNFLLKEIYDAKVIESAFENSCDMITENMDIHIIYCGRYYNHLAVDTLKTSIFVGRIHGDKRRITFERFIEPILLTIIYMRRLNLITKEKMDSYTFGKKYEKESVNDDLECFFESLPLCEKQVDCKLTYFLPKLTLPERTLVQQKDSDYLSTFSSSNPVKESEFKLSESTSKFVHGQCVRRTFQIDPFERIVTMPKNLQIIESMERLKKIREHNFF